VTSGTQPWFISSNNPYEGTYCAESGDIDGNQISIMMITMDVAVDDSISFFRKVSSEFDYDFLQFFIDNKMQDQWSGDEAWARVCYPVTAGIHAFKWSYEKDFWASQGDDCGWIDFIVFPPVSVTTSTDNITANDQLDLNIFPNPFTNLLSVKFSSKQSKFKISLYNSIGQELRVVTDKELSGNENNHVVEMDLGNIVVDKEVIPENN
jgi:hypothetical protein